MPRRLIPLVLLAACAPGNGNADPDEQVVRGFEPPVATNGESPVRYPPDLFERGVEGTVVLRLFVSVEGTIVPESTRVSESSGQAAFDSAAMQGVDRMVFAPARRDGEPVAAVFLQPVHFRHPDGASAGGN